ncbi:DUF2268 domain-containing putative Zn-dependent protease [Aquimarina sp. 2201CG5-10]|uniref:DUF2268 domain-containing putative Zn-dependent protease n=1 Tax=Aquimarina callyspongiae TaxID=3098150 RepID=UPI002AB52623|nr:DUF2268 domain-containing putative Zn-dependent protease [Aquimarina sp. 2201CG5-10]MDY8137081.1 DUF2268 domain-containing putative Zn-dependent protease [Aquimarina sp. 2201CG5-10]
MKKFQVFLLFTLFCHVLFGQKSSSIEVGKVYDSIPMQEAMLSYKLHLKKGEIYEFNIQQNAVDVVVFLEDAQQTELIKHDSPTGKNGKEKFEFATDKTSSYLLKIKPFDVTETDSHSNISIYIRQFSKAELKKREKIRLELAPENAKNVQTLDIDHFWKAFDALKNCKTQKDSISTFQRIYIDRATDGFKEFIRVRPALTAENYVKAVGSFPKFYNSIRQQTYKVKEAEPLIQEVFQNFKKLYPNFKPFKVCFAIGILRTGGTISNEFVLIGSEMSTSTIETDLSEFSEPPYSNLLPFLSYEGDVVQKLKNIVAHECVHSQQIFESNPDAIQCTLLKQTMQEGFCDFIGELLVGENINQELHEYGNTHEKELWKEFKSQLCSNEFRKWMYNYSTAKEKPADLGYYIGYKIAESYYNNAKSKEQAIIDIIELTDPIEFLQQSGYDQKFRKE